MAYDPKTSMDDEMRTPIYSHFLNISSLDLACLGFSPQRRPKQPWPTHSYLMWTEFSQLLECPVSLTTLGAHYDSVNLAALKILFSDKRASTRFQPWNLININFLSLLIDFSHQTIINRVPEKGAKLSTHSANHELDGWPQLLTDLPFSMSCPSVSDPRDVKNLILCSLHYASTQSIFNFLTEETSDRDRKHQTQNADTTNSSQKTEISPAFDSSPAGSVMRSGNADASTPGPPSQKQAMEESSSSNGKVVTAIVVTAAITLAIAVIFFFIYLNFAKKREKNKIDPSFRREAMATGDEFKSRKVRKFNGQDLLYVTLNPSYEEEGEEKRVDVIVERFKKYEPQEVLPWEPSSYGTGHGKATEPVLRNREPTALVSETESPKPPRGLISSLKPPAVPRGRLNSKSRNGNGHTKLKPLHWDKVTANVDHSMVWDEINDGSLRFDDDLIETLFGYTTANNKTLLRNEVSSSRSSSSPTPAAQVFILEPRKSQNTAIVLKSLAISRKEILDALLEGHGLNTDVLEKLTRISPTQEEAVKIIQYRGNPSKLADAESFLHHILKAVPSAFIRINAMLFRSNYDSEILHLKESLQTLESGCKELRTRGLFLKLLEAILKAGNRMNAGTSRGNAQGFNLTALRKLSDVKSTDGKTTLLHFVVEQVVRSEGRRRVLNRSHSMERSNIQIKISSDLNSDTLTEEERNKEYLLSGLPALRDMIAEFSDVRRAAAVEFDSFINTCSTLTARVTETRQLVVNSGNSEAGGFVMGMKGFLEDCEEELKVVIDEQKRIMEVVKRTTEYYQAGASEQKEANLLQLFVIVKDFLDMVDRVSVDISQKKQKKNVVARTGSSSPPPSPPTSNPVKFPDFRLHLMPDMSRATSWSESDGDF
ncbi:formin protein [Salix suchowensis]|nr:formin protein [Salix suchowensis]